MKQNKYDDPTFFAGYSAMARSTGGLESAGEWPAFRSLLPDLKGKQVLDLGCGFGWHCRYAVTMEAASVHGIDISEKMLGRAREINAAQGITYEKCAIEDFNFPEYSFDVVISSLALHYVEHFDLVCRQTCRTLRPGGSFVFSVEHPIFTSQARQDWCYGPDGEKKHWPVDDYRNEGVRRTNWLSENVVKYHRTVETYVNTVIDAGLQIRRLCEPEPDFDSPNHNPDNSDLQDERRRPMFLLVAAMNPVGTA